MVELDVHQELFGRVPDVGVHAEGAIVLHDVENDGLGRKGVVTSEVQDDYGLGLPLQKRTKK